MPTTLEEASKILDITSKYIAPAKAKELFTRLDEEVGTHTSNDSLKQSLAMMRSLVATIPAEPEIVTETIAATTRKLDDKWTYEGQNQQHLWATFYLVVVFHMFVVFGLVASFFVVPFKAPWYESIPIMTFIQFFCFTRVECKLTELENHIRQKLGMKRIGGFVGHYLIKPAKACLK